MQNESDIINNTRERFIFVYDSNRMNYLRKNNFRYIVKGINEKTNKPFWMYDKTKSMMDCLNKFTESN